MVLTGPFKLAPSELNNLCFEPVALPSERRAAEPPGAADLAAPDVRRCRLHSTKGSSLDVWEYEPGEFDWQSDCDHSACILSGAAEVDLADGRVLSLQKGVAFYMPRGLHGHWVIRETLRTVTVRGS
jgi:uncharacterized cupin superfamily protein